jgi:hypothetical protein
LPPESDSWGRDGDRDGATGAERVVFDAREGRPIVRESGWSRAAYPTKARFSTLASLALSLTSCTDRRRYDDISVPEVKEHIEDGTIFAFLDERLGKDLVVDLLDQATLGKIADTWLSIEDTIDERRKFGIENKGLCLLVAYLVEMMQHPSRWGFDPPTL